MREILFRGKRICDDEWIEGYFGRYHNGESDVACISILSNGFFGLSSYEVDPETVGQYIGLTDKNGNKVFEGDVVRWKECDHWAPDDGIVSGYVLYVDGQWLIQRPNIRSYLWRVHSLCEIIGNIHDNPELIGGKR